MTDLIGMLMFGTLRVFAASRAAGNRAPPPAADHARDPAAR